MVSDASKKKVATKKAATAAKRGGKASATTSSKAVDKVTNGIDALKLSDRTCTGVLYSHPLSRDIHKQSVKDMYEDPVSVSKSSPYELDRDFTETDIKKLLKDVERLGSSSMPWKERKALENRNAVALGGKPLKKHRTPLSVAKPAMKNQKKREQKKIEEEQFLGQFSRHASNRKVIERHKPDGGLRASEGYFKKGILDVKHLLQPHPKPRSEESSFEGSKGKKKGKWKGKGKGKQKGKQKGKGKRKGR